MRALRKSIRAGPRWRSRLRPLPRGDTETVPFGRSPCERSEPSEGYTKTFERCQGWSAALRAKVKGSFVRGHPEWKDLFGGDGTDPRGQPGWRTGTPPRPSPLMEKARDRSAQWTICKQQIHEQERAHRCGNGNVANRLRLIRHSFVKSVAN